MDAINPIKQSGGATVAGDGETFCGLRWFLALTENSEITRVWEARFFLPTPSFNPLTTTRFYLPIDHRSKTTTPLPAAAAFNPELEVGTHFLLTSCCHSGFIELSPAPETTPFR